MIEKDLPIKEIKEDALGRASFAEQLIHMIEGYVNAQNTEKDGIVIGLEGPWGSGKTSLFHLMEQYLNTDLLEVRSFNSWFATDKESLLRLFFETLGKAAEKDNASLGNYIVQMGQALASRFTRWMPVLQGALTLLDGSGITSAAAEVVTKLIEQAGEPCSVMELKEKVERDFRDSQGKWILFFIDDIDRLADEEIALIFQLVKNIADFPKVIYVLAYDKNIVVHALNQVQQGRGLDYLHKVVQVSVPVPEAGKYQIGQILWNSVQDVIQHRPGDSLDVAHLRKIWQCILAEYIHSVRDCRRIVNAFSFRYGACGDDCDVGDLLAVTVMDLYEPELIPFLYRRRNTFLVQEIGILSGGEQISAALNRVEQDMKTRFKLEEKPGLWKMLAEMFPEFAHQVRWSVKAGTGESGRIVQRICDPDCFDRYFQLLLPADAVPQVQVRRILAIESPEALTAELTVLRQAGQMASFLRSAQSICASRDSEITIDESFLQHWLLALSPLRLGTDTEAGLDAVSSLELRFLQMLLERALKKEEGDLWDGERFLSVIENPNISLSMLWKVLRQCGLGQQYPWGMWSLDGWGIQKPVLSAELFERGCIYFAKRVKEATAVEPERFLREEEIYGILTTWRWYSKKQADGQFDRFWQASASGLVTTLKAISYIYVGRVLSADEPEYRVWRWYSDAECVVAPSIQEDLLRFCQSSESQQLTPGEKEKAAAYLVLVNKMKTKNQSVQEKNLEATEPEVKQELQIFAGTTAEGIG